MASKKSREPDLRALKKDKLVSRILELENEVTCCKSEIEALSAKVPLEGDELVAIPGMEDLCARMSFFSNGNGYLELADPSIGNDSAVEVPLKELAAFSDFITEKAIPEAEAKAGRK